jgi:hypothetical protein
VSWIPVEGHLAEMVTAAELSGAGCVLATVEHIFSGSRFVELIQRDFDGNWCWRDGEPLDPESRRIVAWMPAPDPMPLPAVPAGDLSQRMGAAIASFHASLEHSEKARGDAFERLAVVVMAVLSAQDEPESAAKDVIRLLYWNAPEITVKWIAEMFGMRIHDVRKTAGTGTIEIICPECSSRTLYEVPSREHMKGYKGWKCPECIGRDRERMDERYRRLREEAACRPGMRGADHGAFLRIWDEDSKRS